MAAMVMAAMKVTVNLHIDDGGALSDDERELVERHFARLGLGDRYTHRAHSYMASFKASVKGQPGAAVANALHSKIENPKFGEPVNGWRPALFRAVNVQPHETLDWLNTPYLHQLACRMLNASHHSWRTLVAVQGKA